MLQMPPHSNNLESSVKQLIYSNGQQYFHHLNQSNNSLQFSPISNSISNNNNSISNNNNNIIIPSNTTPLHLSSSSPFSSLSSSSSSSSYSTSSSTAILSSNLNLISTEQFEEFFQQNNLNSSIDESNQSASSMDEILNASTNPLEDFLINIESGIIDSNVLNVSSNKNEPFDTSYDISLLNLDPNQNLDDQFSSYTMINHNPHQQQQQQQQQHQHNQHDAQQQHIIQQQKHNNITFETINIGVESTPKYFTSTPTSQSLKPISSLPTTSTNSNHCLIDLSSIKQEHLIDDSNSSFLSGSSEPLPSLDKRMSTSSSSTTMSFGNMKKSSGNEKRYGPIVVRPRKNPAPTLASGRKSKYAALTQEEERKREIRRSRNRQAAEKCKQKRNEIEDRLESDLKILHDEQTMLQNERIKLTETKTQLELMLKQHENCPFSSTASTGAQTNYSTIMKTSTTSTNSPNLLVPIQNNNLSYQVSHPCYTSHSHPQQHHHHHQQQQQHPHHIHDYSPIMVNNQNQTMSNLTTPTSNMNNNTVNNNNNNDNYSLLMNSMPYEQINPNVYIHHQPTLTQNQNILQSKPTSSFNINYDNNSQF